MQKIIPLITLILLVAAPGLAKAAPLGQTQEGGQAYTVQAEDSLSRLAQKFYQDFAAWPVIQLATNAKAAQDSRFTVIKNPNVIEAGQILWIPNPDEAERLLAGYAPTNPELQPLTSELLAEFETYLENARQRFRIPGAAVVVVQGNQILFAKGFGVRELGQAEPVTPETIFAVGSTTKAMTSIEQRHHLHRTCSSSA